MRVNDHNRLRDDSVLALAVGRQDVTGAQRARARDQGHPLAGASTLNRFELGGEETAATDRYKRIVADFDKMYALLVSLFTESHAAPPERIVLDIDATDDLLHGQQDIIVRAGEGAQAILPARRRRLDFILLHRPYNPMNPTIGAIPTQKSVFVGLDVHSPHRSPSS